MNSPKHETAQSPETQHHADTVHAFEQHAESVIESTGIYRRLAEELSHLTGNDKSLQQPLVIQAKDADDELISISTKRAHWAKATCVNSMTPPEDIQGRVIKNVVFGYSKGDKFNRIGAIPWIAIAPDGSISHMGLPNNPIKAQALENVIKEHIFGFQITKEHQERLQNVYEKLFETLGDKNSPTKQLAKQFFSKRNHKPSWTKKGKFVYYKPELFDAEAFKKTHGFTNDDLYRAGILELSVSNDGRVVFSKRSDECVLIPFFTKNTQKNGEKEICNWRMRVINPGNGAKYLSHPLIRSHMSSPEVDEEMYNSHLLEKAKGKDIFFTEGEFKCHVSTELSGFITLGIPGITMVTDAMLDKLIDSGARSITIALDADTRAKSAKRADDITDSERAAYEIAWRYERRVKERAADGSLPSDIPTLKIGLLTVTKDGDKQGLDDWLIPMERKEAKKAMEKLRDTALTLSEYAAAIGAPGQGLNEPLAQIRYHRTEVRGLLRATQNYINRIYGVGEPEHPDANYQKIVTIKQQFEDILADLDSTQTRGLWTLYGRNRFNLPGKRFRFLTSKPVPRADKKTLYDERTKTNLIKKADGDIICSEVYFSDMPQKERAPDAEGQTLPYSMKDVMSYLCGIQSREEIYNDFTRGLEALGFSADINDVFQKLQKNRDLHQFSRILTAGFLSRSFRTDEYSFSQSLACTYRADRFIEEFTKIDLVIFSKKKDRIEMIVSPVMWAPNVAKEDATINPFRGYYHNTAVLSAKDISYIRDNNPTNPQRASILVGAKNARVRSFLRNPILESQKAKFNRIVSALTTDSVGREGAYEYWSQYGLSTNEVDAARLSILHKDDWMRLARLLDSKQLLNQAIQAGFYRITPEGRIAPAFNGPVSLLPSQDGGSISIRVGVSAADGTNKRIEPAKKRFYVLRGARSTAPSMDPTSHLFGGSALTSAKNKTIVLCYNEHDAIVLRNNLARSKYVVVGLNSDLTPRSKIIASIKQSGCLNAVIIGKPNSDRRYEGLVPDKKIPPEFFEVLDLERRFNSVRKGETPVQLSWVPLEGDLSDWIKVQLKNKASSQIQDELSEIIDLQTQNPSEVMLSQYGITPSAYSAIARLSRVRERYEILVESIGLPTEKDIQQFAHVTNELSRQLEIVANMYEKKGVTFPKTPQEYFKTAYSWVEITLPETSEEYKAFKDEYPKGIPLRRIFRGISTSLRSRWPVETNVETTELINPEWTEKALAVSVDQKAQEAQKADSKRKLQEILSLALKHNFITHATEDKRSLYSISMFKREDDQIKRAMHKERTDAVIGNKGFIRRNLAFAQIEFFLNKDGQTTPMLVNGHARSKYNAEHIAAQFALKYLGNLKTDDGKKLKALWYEKFEKPRLKKLRAQKAELKRLRGEATLTTVVEKESGEKSNFHVRFREVRL